MFKWFWTIFSLGAPEEWRQQIIVVAKHKFSSIKRIDLENI